LEELGKRMEELTKETQFAKIMDAQWHKLRESLHKVSGENLASTEQLNFSHTELKTRHYMEQQWRKGQ